MELNPGYKRTEVGIIPKDWNVKTIGDVFAIAAGGDFDPALSSPIQDELHCYPVYSNAISENGLYGFCSYNDHQAGSITVTARGTLGVASYRDHKFTAIGRVLVLQPYRPVDGRFFSEFMNNRIDFVVESTGVPQLTAPQISKYKIAFPPLPEQQAIAAALSDVDALISALDKLIAKKRDIKQAAMQQLLTGKKRLPGFSGEWEVRKLGDYCLFESGTGFKESYQGKKSGNYPFIKVSDMNLAGNEIYIRYASNWVSSKDMEALNASPVPPNSIVLAKVGAALLLNRRRITVMETIVDNNMMAAIPKSNVSCLYLYYFLLGIDLGKIAQEGALPSVNANDLGNIKVAIPLLKEQAAITAILSDMDAEIAALETRRDKTRALKQGMMQGLLTGRIRLT